MTNHGTTGRGRTQYCVHNPENETNPTFILPLQHSRIREALDRLIETGPNGCTSYEHPAPRLASYVHRLRKLGVIILTLRERHNGAFPGTHARYVLISRVTTVRARGR